MAPGGTPAFGPVLGLPGGRSALLISTAAYADAQLAWLRPPVSGAGDLAAALANPRAGGFAVEYGPAEEAWGVRRFFVRDPFGRLVNVLGHR